MGAQDGYLPLHGCSYAACGTSGFPNSGMESRAFPCKQEQRMHAAIRRHLWTHRLVLARKRSFPPAEPHHGPHWLQQLPAHEPAAASSLSALLLPAWLVFIAGNASSPVVFSPQTVCCCSVWSGHAVPQLGETIREGANLETLAFLHSHINFLFSGFPPQPKGLEVLSLVVEENREFCWQYAWPVSAGRLCNHPKVPGRAGMCRTPAQSRLVPASSLLLSATARKQMGLSLTFL